MKLQERPRETLDRLPELPEGVVVPDDISGITHPPAARTVAGGIRWMRWLVALVVIAIGAGVATVVLTRGDDTQTAVQELGSDRHLTAVQDLSPGAVVVDYMELYGTDNPTFVTPRVPELGSDRHLGTVRDLTVTMDYMQIYGTDNPTFVAAPVMGSDRHLGTVRDLTPSPGMVDTGEFLGLEGYLGVQGPADMVETGEYLGLDRLAGAVYMTSHMELYGTDNPAFAVEGLAEVVETGEFLGLDQLTDTVRLSDYMELYGTDNPVLE